MILWCRSKVLKAEPKVDKKAVVKAVRFLQEGVKTTNQYILHSHVIKSVVLLLCDHIYIYIYIYINLKFFEKIIKVTQSISFSW